MRRSKNYKLFAHLRRMIQFLTFFCEIIFALSVLKHVSYPYVFDFALIYQTRCLSF